MRILYVSTQYPPLGRGGAEKSVSTLAEAMVRDGHDVAVACLYPGAKDRIDEYNGVRVYRMPIDNLYWPLDRADKPSTFAKMCWHGRDRWNRQAAGRFAEILDREKPDVVHSHNISGFSVSVWAEVKKRKIRLVHTMHDYYLICIRSALYRNGAFCNTQCMRCRIVKAVAKESSQLVDQVIAVSDFVLAKHRDNGYFNDIPASVIYNINPELIACQSCCTAAKRQQLTFGFLGAIIEEKGIETLLQATFGLTGDSWHLRIAGIGRNEDYVSRLKSKYTDPRIEWLGFTMPAEFFSSIDVLIVPSLWPDPAPYVVVEALSAGKSLICANSGGIPELARLGLKVKLYPPASVVALTEAMSTCLCNPSSWREGGFQHPQSAKAFGEQEIVAQHLNWYLPQS